MRLNELRKKKGITQSQLAVELGVDTTVISNYETGYRVPRWITICKIAEFFNVSIDDLEFGELDNHETA